MRRLQQELETLQEDRDQWERQQRAAEITKVIDHRLQMVALSTELGLLRQKNEDLRRANGAVIKYIDLSTPHRRFAP